jgi:hypothetical protein
MRTSLSRPSGDFPDGSISEIDEVCTDGTQQHNVQYKVKRWLFTTAKYRCQQDVRFIKPALANPFLLLRGFDR